MATTRKTSTTAEVIRGFTRVTSQPPPRRLVVAVGGGEKEGKTSFLLSAPSPIAYINVDTGAEGVIEKWADGKEVMQASFAYRDVTDQEEWKRVYAQVKGNIRDAMATPRIRTIGIDTETELWELARLASFGRTDHIKPHHYGPVNAEYRDIIRSIYDTDKSLILLRKLKDVYVDDKYAGYREPAGFKDVPYLVQVNLITWRRHQQEEGKRKSAKLNPRAPGGTFGITIVDCRQDASLAGMEYEDPTNTFPFLAMSIYPDTNTEDWE